MAKPPGYLETRTARRIELDKRLEKFCVTEEQKVAFIRSSVLTDDDVARLVNRLSSQAKLK